MGQANLTAFCRAVRPPAPPSGSPITTTRLREAGRAAVGVYHREGEASADAYLERAWTPAGTLPAPAFAVQAQALVSAFGRYKRLNGADGRPVRSLGLGRQVAVGGHVVDVRLDVVLHTASDAVVPRMLLWDRGHTRPEHAATIACLGLRAGEMVFGRGSVEAVQVWQLSGLVSHTVPAGVARAKLSDAAAVLSRIGV